MVRCVERFRLVLASDERKLFVVLNLNPQLWREDDFLDLFWELQRNTKNFLLLIVDCSLKNLGEIRDPQILSQFGRDRERMVVYRLPCVGDNTGSYFRNELDAQRVRSLLLEPYRFNLAMDPLDSQPAQAKAEGQELQNPNVQGYAEPRHVKPSFTKENAKNTLHTVLNSCQLAFCFWFFVQPLFDLFCPFQASCLFLCSNASHLQVPCRANTVFRLGDACASRVADLGKFLFCEQSA